jgi:hypothetical protein
MPDTERVIRRIAHVVYDELNAEARAQRLSA